ncbi:MAG: hypothetical protein E7564_05300 [Ruminococcaceae bacterium]|nr:hypothetical protein [Oscillospiraceae bacterium]
MIKERKIRYYYIGAIISLFVAFMCRQVSLLLAGGDAQSLFISVIVITLRNIIHISLLVLWCVSLYNRIINKRVKIYVMLGGALLAYWVLARIIKNDFTVTNHETLGRYFWYSYYIPMILVPLIGVFIVNHIDKPYNYKSTLFQNLLCIPAVLLIGIVMSNDYHNLVFSFPEGIMMFEDVYNYETLYWVVLAWMISCGGYFVFMLIKKSRVPESQEMQSLPAVIFGLAVIFWFMFIFRLITCDLTTVNCSIIVLLVESAIQCNMLPSNNNYIEVLSTSTIAAQIVDNDYNKKIVSSTAMDLTIEQIKSAEKERIMVDDYLVNVKEIPGGYVIWQDDVSKINKLIDNLKDTKEQLSEENDLLTAELSVRERRARADEENKLYDEIAKEVSKQLKSVRAMINNIENGASNKNELMAKICVLGSYIKRRGNLLLLGKRDGDVNSQELEFSLRETLDNLKLLGAYTVLESKCEGEIKLKYLVGFYDLVESLIEYIMDNITAMMIRVNITQDSADMNIQIGLSRAVDNVVLESIKIKYLDISFENQDEDIIINATLKKEAVSL